MNKLNISVFCLLGVIIFFTGCSASDLKTQSKYQNAGDYDFNTKIQELESRIVALEKQLTPESQFTESYPQRTTKPTSISEWGWETYSANDLVITGEKYDIEVISLQFNPEYNSVVLNFNTYYIPSGADIYFGADIKGRTGGYGGNREIAMVDADKVDVNANHFKFIISFEPTLELLETPQIEDVIIEVTIP